jgi:hypothetical protein
MGFEPGQHHERACLEHQPMSLYPFHTSHFSCNVSPIKGMQRPDFSELIANS